MNKMLLMGIVVGGSALFGSTETAQAGHRGCDYGYSIGVSSAARGYAVPAYNGNYYYSQPSYGYYSYPYYGGHYGLHFDFFGHGGHHGFGHFSGGHFGGGHFSGGHHGGHHGGHGHH